MDKVVAITFLTEYEVSSGLGDGHWADNRLTRDHNGLPCLPGRAVKGALREGAWRLGQCRKDLELMEPLLWGTRSTARITNRQGLLRVGNGELPSSLKSMLLAQDPALREATVRDMTVRRTQTALEDGQVKDGTLRTLECGIPGLTFLANLEIPADLLPDWLSSQWLEEYLRCVCAAVKSMGGNRSRGLGVCRVELADDVAQGQPVALPQELAVEELRKALADDLAGENATEAEVGSI